MSQINLEQCKELLTPLIGKKFPDEITKEQLTNLLNVQVIRCLGPTDMATMDYRMDRLNIRLDEDRKINGQCKIG